jgi:hypothetical protein
MQSDGQHEVSWVFRDPQLTKINDHRRSVDFCRSAANFTTIGITSQEFDQIGCGDPPKASPL